MRSKLDQDLDYFILAALAGLCYVLFFHELGGIGFLGPDEPRYAAVAREMYLSGDYITPRLLGENWFEKPVLIYWGAALGYAIFGIGETGARLPSALGATLSVFLVYWAGRRLFTRGIGLSGAVILATSIGFFGLARAASTDMPLTASLTAALSFFLVGNESSGASRRWYFYAFYAALGFGVLAKGPVAIVLPVFALVMFLIWRGPGGEWKKWHPEGIFITGLVAGPWYAAVTVANGMEFINVFILEHNLGRFTSDVYGHEQPFYFYLPVLLLMTFPWSFLLIPALRRRFGRNEQLILLWALAPLILFSLSGSKLPAYILPMLPPLALLCAREVTRRDSLLSYRIAAFAQAALWVAVGVAFGFFGDQINIDIQVNGMAILAITLVMAAALVAIGIWLPPPAFGTLNVLAIAILVFVITAAVFPRVQSVESMRPWETELNRFVSEGQDIVLYRPRPWMEYGLEYYRDRHVKTVLSEEELTALATPARTLCISEIGMLDELSTSETVAIEVVHSMGNQVAFWFWIP
jgi:4-amino-4-deoxy-L-arabinose transferase-like glycosyltransferase